MRVRLALAVILATFQLPIVAAQTSNLAGTWAVEVKGGSGQTEDGTNWNFGAIKGTLALEQKGEAITGTWKGAMPDPWKLSGKVQKNSFELQTEVRNIPAERDGEKTTIPRSWIFRGSVEGDKLSGLFILAGGEGQAPSQPFTAARAK